MGNQSFSAQQSIEENLARIPFFQSLSHETLSAISAKLKFIHLDHDEIVFVEDSPADAIYLIESGQVQVSVRTSTGQVKIINYLGPGNFFGEMALLLDQPRSATVTVTLDADLWVLYKADLDDLLSEYPDIALELTRELSRRLSDVMSETHNRQGYNLLALFGDQSWLLAQKIHDITKQRVVLFDITGREISHRTPANFQSDSLVVLKATSDLTSDDLVETLSILVDGYDWVLLALPSVYDEITDKALRLAKATVLLNSTEETWISATTNGRIFHCDTTSPKEIGRTARKITRRVIGLALSSGGARGIAHIGVLKVLEAANVPIDMIAGTSAGSLFGGLYASGKSIDDVTHFAKGLIKKVSLKSGLWDPKIRLPWDGLLKGDATLKFLAKNFENKSFEDTQVPFYVVATDVLSGEEVVFDNGSLAEAVRASIGMIGVFSPYKYNGHYLIDGGATNPVPATILADRGADIIIASSVIPSMEEERSRNQNNLSEQGQPNFLGVLSSMMSIMEREIVKTRVDTIDVLIRPKVEIYTAMDYDKAEDFVRLGEEAAVSCLPMINTLLNN